MGLIWDLKNKIERSQLTNFTRLPFRISKIRDRISTQTNHEERRKILVVKLIVESASENRKSKSSNSNVGDELKFQSSRFITSGMDKGDRIELEDNATNKDKKI